MQVQGINNNYAGPNFGNTSIKIVGSNFDKNSKAGQKLTARILSNDYFTNEHKKSIASLKVRSFDSNNLLENLCSRFWYFGGTHNNEIVLSLKTKPEGNIVTRAWEQLKEVFRHDMAKSYTYQLGTGGNDFSEALAKLNYLLDNDFRPMTQSEFNMQKERYLHYLNMFEKYENKGE